MPWLNGSYHVEAQYSQHGLALDLLCACNHATRAYTMHERAGMAPWLVLSRLTGD